ncbi:hypothetical protein ACF07V_30695 [Streptomyces sp. NPDC015661]|uniref:hypothetical protein n=1 Tax=Streptomyces sp. NPDC015661 TaxID=3364961 RepID=UPI0036F68A22
MSKEQAAGPAAPQAQARAPSSTAARASGRTPVCSAGSSRVGRPTRPRPPPATSSCRSPAPSRTVRSRPGPPEDGARVQLKFHFWSASTVTHYVTKSGGTVTGTTS